MTVGEIVKQYRDEHGLSQRQFAERCGGITNGYISMIEQGKNPSTGKPIILSIEKFALLARAMGMSLHQLADIADDSPVSTGGSEYPPDPNPQPTNQQGSKEWRTISQGFERMEKQKYDEFMAFFNMLKATKPEFFNEGIDDDDA